MTRSICRIAVAALLWLPAELVAAPAAEAPPVRAVAAGVAVRAGSVILDLEGGDAVRLQGVVVPEAHARTAWAALVQLLPEGTPLRLAQAAGGGIGTVACQRRSSGRMVSGFRARSCSGGWRWSPQRQGRPSESGRCVR
jgi:hypothetical protein